MYVFKIIQGIAPNLEGQKYRIKTNYHVRRGRVCIVPGLGNQTLASVTSMIEASFSVRGPKLFNCLPMNLRNFNGSVDTFKGKLDKFLKCIPDRPSLPAYQQSASSNSILDQLAAQRAAGIFYN